MRLVIGRVNHLQLCIPPGADAVAREFYEGVLGLKEIPKPESLMSRGGFWYAMGDGQLHIGIDPVIERTKSHPAYEVAYVKEIRAYLETLGVPTRDEPLIPGRERFSFLDPFGNRIEFMEFI